MPALRIALVGNYNAGVTAHRAIPRALAFAARTSIVSHEWVETETIGSPADLQAFDGIWVVPNSPYRNTDGALIAIRVARESGIPFLGTCGGFQHAVLEYARNVLGWTDADHAELNPDATRLVVTALVCSLVEATGALHFTPGSRLAQAYASHSAIEGYHCRFGVSPEFAKAVEGSALHVTAVDVDGDARGIELEGHPFFVATLFQPERAALADRVSPIVRAFITAAGIYADRPPRA